MNVIIVGGGASGLIASITAREQGNNVTLLEKNNKVLEKLAITGNGRANISNDTVSVSQYNGDDKFLTDVLADYTVDDVKDFFLKIGLVTTNLGEYIYPYSLKATTVVDALRTYAQKIGVKIKTGNDVQSIKKENNTFYVDCGYVYECEKLIIATGGQSYANTGSTGDGYKFARGLGHTVTSLSPGLVPLCVDDAITKASGVRVNCTINYNNTIEAGQLQITTYGISGIAVFNISSTINVGESITIDFVSDYSASQIVSYWSKLSAEAFTAKALLETFFDKKLVGVFLEKANINPNEILDQKQIETLAKLIKNYELTISDKLGYDKAQVTVGGVDTSQVDSQTMESLIVPNLYFAGEVLDVDGKCGGFNLHFAWASGYKAGLLQNK